MTDTFKVLAQAYLDAATLTTLYTVPAATSAVISTIKVTNQDLFPTTFRVSVAVAGAADTAAQYLYYDVPIAAKDTFSATEGWSLATTDVLRGWSQNGKCSFNLFGVEVT